MPAPRTVLEDLPFCLARTTLSFRRFTDQSLRELGVETQAPGLATVLHALDELGDCAVSSLVEKTHLPNGTLTGLLDSLETAALVRRSRNPADGRSWIIKLTARGRRLCAKLQERHRTVMKVFRSVLSAAEADELTRLLEKLTARMRGYVADEVEPSSAPAKSRKAPARAAAKQPGRSPRAARPKAARKLRR